MIIIQIAGIFGIYFYFKVFFRTRYKETDLNLPIQPLSFLLTSKGDLYITFIPYTPNKKI